MIKIISLIFVTIILTGVSCKKKECDGTNVISGVLKNGTTMQGMKKVQLKFTIYDVEHNTTATNVVELGTVMTDDTGGFRFEYPCRNKGFSEIAIDAQPPYGGIRARIPYSTKATTVMYYSTQGKAQIVLSAKAPIANDTLFIGMQDLSGNFTELDSFIAPVPYLWKKKTGSTGGIGTVIWGRGRVNFNKATKDIKLKQWETIIITGDPFVDSIYVKY